MQLILQEAPYALLIGGAVIVGLYLANFFYDSGIKQYISRKVGHGVGGMGFLLAALLFSSAVWPLALAGGFTLILGGARMVKPEMFRGVGGTGRQHAMAEVFFPAAGTISIAIGWLWLGSPWLAVVPILFMAWGDMVTGLIRSAVYGREVKGNWGSVGMIVVCLLIAYFFKPFWIGAIGAVVATLAERFTPMSHSVWDDNWSIVIASLLAMTILSQGGIV